MKKTLVLLCAVALAFVVSGCQRGDSRSAISGTVSLNGEPLPIGIINFIPENPDPTKGVVAGSAQITDGKYEIPSKDAGLLPGTYKVNVISNVTRLKSTGEIVDPTDVKDGVVNPLDCTTENMVPPEYTADQTQETVEIGKVKKTEYNLDMKKSE